MEVVTEGAASPRLSEAHLASARDGAPGWLRSVLVIPRPGL